MDIIVEEYTFYNNGSLYSNIQESRGKRRYEDVPEKAELSIIIIGTEKQNNVLYKRYIEKHNLDLDECYDITEDIPENKMEIIKNRYINNNKKGFIL